MRRIIETTNKITEKLQFMRKTFLTLMAVLLATATATADVQSKKWSEVATKMSDSWYGTDEAKTVAENVLLYQKNSGGWGKNIEMHKTLSDSEKQEVINAKSDKSCFDNTATTMEMRFLAKVYKHFGDDRYYNAFNKGMNCLITAQYTSGGWPQYYPLRGGYSDNITFNDDLMVNILKLMWDVYQAQNEFAYIADYDSNIKTRAKSCYDKGLQCILDCQIDDYGKKSIWCAQHDPVTKDPDYGRPHEHPSFSGSEGAKVLDFLMTIENPSEEVKQAVVAAAEWFMAHYVADKKVTDVKENGSTVDRQIVDAAGERLWGRFMQLSGETATRVYNDMINELKSNRRDVYSVDGTKYRYYCSDIIKDSYDPTREYEFMYGIYDSNRQQLYYRFLYNYADTDPVFDSNNVQIETSLGADNRRSYQYVGNWPNKIVYTTYPKWRTKHGITDGIETPETKPVRGAGKIYNLMGVKLADEVTLETLQQLSPGIYIVSGKKYVVK